MLQYALKAQLNTVANRKLSVSKTLVCNRTMSDAIRIITAKGTHRLVRLTLDDNNNKCFTNVNPKELVYEIGCIDGYLYTQQILTEGGD